MCICIPFTYQNNVPFTWLRSGQWLLVFLVLFIPLTDHQQSDFGEKAACFFTQWAWVSDSYVFLRPVPGVSGQRMHLGGQMWLSPKGLVGRRAGSSNWSVYFFILSQRWSTEGQQPGVLEGEEVGETPGWGKRCVCARVSTRVYVHVHCTARPRVYAVSKWTDVKRFILSVSASLHVWDLLHGEEFSNCSLLEKNLTTLLQRKRQERNKKLDSFLYKHKSGIDMSMLLS